MKKFLVFFAGILLVFGMVGSASADWYGTYYIPDPISDIDGVTPWTFDTYFPMVGDDWVDQAYVWWTNDASDPYQNITYTPFNKEEDTFTWDIADVNSGLDVTLYLSGLLEIESLTPGLVEGTLTANPGNNGELYFSAIQLIFDPPETVNDGNPVPEPATMLLLGSGLIGLSVFGRKKFFKK